ncbi:uncharacterized protein RJT20DRAFT_1144 [Scheffersomyces xylosifermentans]|uniref:uncharacterized protein n=1 Tax=Scheffersomyces xylosifermentans TaxID=1304137 RepID=UPI00315C97D5
MNQRENSWTEYTAKDTTTDNQGSTINSLYKAPGSVSNSLNTLPPGDSSKLIPFSNNNISYTNPFPSQEFLGDNTRSNSAPEPGLINSTASYPPNMHIQMYHSNMHGVSTQEQPQLSYGNVSYQNPSRGQYSTNTSTDSYGSRIQSQHPQQMYHQYYPQSGSFYPDFSGQPNAKVLNPQAIQQNQQILSNPAGSGQPSNLFPLANPQYPIPLGSQDFSLRPNDQIEQVGLPLNSISYQGMDNYLSVNNTNPGALGLPTPEVRQFHQQKVPRSRSQGAKTRRMSSSKGDISSSSSPSCNSTYNNNSSNSTTSTSLNSSNSSSSSNNNPPRGGNRNGTSSVTKRSRMGCLTCRQRKKRCCETRPKCTECNRLGLNCVWPRPGTEHKNKPKDAKGDENTINHELYGKIKVLRGLIDHKST